jgi:5-methylcytosine-specific restriction endonuclease McrA
MGTWGSDRTGTSAHRNWARTVLRRDRECVRCGDRDALEADHILPVAFGGAEHDPANGQALCRTCHKAKTKRESIEGLRRRAARGRVEPEPHPGLTAT